jgi:Fe-Mn family superoxide dismutase
MTARAQDLPFDPAALNRLSRELYLASLGGDGVTMEPAAKLMLEASFSSVERWRDAFIGLGKALRGGSGWVMLVFQPREGTLVNLSSADRAADHRHVMTGGVPILALAMDEHAHHMDFGAAAGAYVVAFMGNINWAAVYKRYQRAVNAAGEPFGANQDEVGDALVLDVRRAGVFEKAQKMIPGARWCNPADVPTWAAELPEDRELLVYCVYGHEVSRVTALRLQAAGVKARYLVGGIDAWLAAGRPLVDKRGSPAP